MALEHYSRPGRTDLTDRQQIQQCLTQWQQAMQQKDAAAAVACYSDEAMLFNLAPPLRQRMNRQALQAWLDTWKSGPRYEMREVELVAGNDVAYCHCLTHLTGTRISGEQNDLWFRATVCLRKIQGQWRLTHEHTSVPFAMDGSLQAAVDLEP